MTDEDASLRALLLGLEQTLMQPAVRLDSKRASELIDHDFIEIGRSGRIYDKTAILEELRKWPQDDPPAVRDFSVFRLSAELALVTYQTERTSTNDITMRSSIWVVRNGNWQIRFHQGTALRPPAAS